MIDSCGDESLIDSSPDVYPINRCIDEVFSIEKNLIDKTYYWSMTDETELKKLAKTIDDYRRPALVDNFLKPNTQFIQRATIINRLVFEVIKVFERFRDHLKINRLRSASVRTGAGFLINTENPSLNDINRDNIVEVIDFDPVRNNLMVIGNEPPAVDAAIHWFIYRGLPDINGIIIIDNAEILNNFQAGSFPVMTLADEILHLNSALEILKSVKTSKITLMTGRTVQGIVIVGKTVSEANIIFEKTIEKYSSSDHSKQVE